MKKIDVIKLGSPEDTTGPSGTLRRLKENKEVFLKNGLDFNIFYFNDLATQKFSSSTVNQKFNSSTLTLIKSWLKTKIRFSQILSLIWAQRTRYQSKSLVKKYLSLARNADVIVFHEYFVCLEYLQLAGTNQSKTILFHHSNGKMLDMYFESFPMLKGTPLAKLLENKYPQVVRAVSRNTFISKIGMENFYEGNPDIPFKNLTFFHNGINDLPKDQIPDINKRSFLTYNLICIGTLSERKGQRLILHALSLLDEKTRKKFRLTMIGTGPDHYNLLRLCDNYNLNNIVSFEGKVNNAQVHHYFHSANIFILMSNNEGLPISIIEAMRSGLGIISTRVSGIPELVEPLKNGILINPSEIELLAVFKNIDSYDWKSFGLKSREKFLKDFLFEKMIVSYINMLKKTIDLN